MLWQKFIDSKAHAYAEKIIHKVLCAVNLHDWHYSETEVWRFCGFCDSKRWRHNGKWKRIKGFVMAVWSEEVTKPTITPEGIYVYPDRKTLDAACLANPLLINLPAQINSNCPVCHGTGSIGKKVLFIGATKGQVVFCPKCLIKNMNREIERKRALLIAKLSGAA